MIIFSIRVYVLSIIVIVTRHVGDPDVGDGKCRNSTFCLYTESDFIASLSIWEASFMNLWESQGVAVNAELKFGRFGSTDTHTAACYLRKQQ